MGCHMRPRHSGGRAMMNWEPNWPVIFLLAVGLIVWFIDTVKP